MDIKLHKNHGFKWYDYNSVIYVKGYAFDKENRLLRDSKLVDHLIKLNVDTDINHALKELNGFYSIIINKEDRIIAIVDRNRSMPLFYALKETGELFLSDDAHWIKEKIGDEKIEGLSRQEFLLTGYVTGKNTLYSKVKQLQAGEFLIYDKKKRTIEIHRYFELHHSNFRTEDVQQLIEDLDQVHVAVFTRLIESLNGCTAVIPLSGGEDSRLIAIMLKRLGYENVICFTYGKIGNWEAQISKEVADFLGYPWIFVPYSEKQWYELYRSREMLMYFRYSDGLASLPHIQDWPAVSFLKEKKLIPKDSIFIPGHSGDFLAGSHIPSNYLDLDIISKKELVESIYHKHYSLWCSTYKSKLREIFEEKIAVSIKEKTFYTPEEAADQSEFWNWQERQAKFICNSVRVYEYFGYEWRMPLWDLEIINFWSRIPVEQRINRQLYFNYVNSRHKFLNIRNKTLHNTILTKSKALKLPQLLKTYFRMMYYLLSYKKHPHNLYGIVHFSNYFIYVLRGMTSVNSILVDLFIRLYNKNYFDQLNDIKIGELIDE